MPEPPVAPAPAEMLTLEAYVTEVLAELEPLPAADTPLDRAHGLVLAQDVEAALPVPPWTNSAMDGYAVRAQDVEGATARTPVVLPVSGDVPAGIAPGPLRPGTAQRIMTGAMLPEGADAVVRVEDTDQAPGPRPLPAEVAIRAAARTGLNVRRAGEDLGAGDRVMGAGAVLTATAVSALASVGLGSVRAVPRPRVAIVSTGAELVPPGEEPPAGAVPDSNSLLLSGLVTDHGAALASVTRSADTAGSLAAALTEAARGADLIVTSGGVSAGAFDPLTMLARASGAGDEAGGYTESYAENTGGRGESGAGAPPPSVRLRFAKVAMQPGKPQAHGAIRIDDGALARWVPIISLPGNPVSALVSFTTIVAPALARLAGHDAVGRPGPPPPGTGPARARAATAWRTPPNRRQHVPVRFVAAPAERAGSSESWVEPTHRLGSGSHLVASLPAAQALAVVDADAPDVAVGDEVGLIPLSTPPAPGGIRPPSGPSGRSDRIPGEAPSEPLGSPDSPGIRLSHLDEAGAARMVDVTAKAPTVRTASAVAFVSCSPAIVTAVREGAVPKGDVLAVARVAGIAAAKRVPQLLPLAHVIGVHGCRVDLTIEDAGVRIESTVRTADRTGVEMEALTSATVAGLAIVDMVKGVDRAVALREAKVTAKSGGRSGDWVRPDDAD